MSRQLRVTSLLVSKKTSEVADGSPSPSVSSKAKAAWSTSPSPETPQSKKKQQALQLQEQVVPSTSPLSESPAPTRVTRTRSSSQASPVFAPSSVESPLPRTQSSSASSSITTPLKRKNAASAVEPQAPESAKKKRVEQSSNEEADVAQAETAMVDTPATSTISANQEASAESIEPSESEPEMNPSLSLDAPIVLPPLNPIPLNAPIINKTMSRGASLLARSNPRASLLNPHNPRALRLDPSTVAQITPSTASMIRSANASHSALMATIEALAPGSTTLSSSVPSVAAAAAATAARAPSLVDPAMPSLESLAQKVIATGHRIEAIQPRPVAAAAPSTSSVAPSSSPFTVAPRYQPILDPSHTLTELKSRTIASLPLPVHFSFLTSVFSATDSSLSMLLLRFRSAISCSWVREIQPATQRIVGKKIDLSQLQQLMSIYPDCYRLQENHTLDAMGRFTKDYKLGFGSSNGESEEEESKKRLQAVTAASALAHGEIPVIPSSASIIVGAQNANLVARRKELEHRMQVYVYEAHQAYLMNLRQTLLAIIEGEKQAQAGQNSKAEVEAKLAEIKRAKVELPSVNAFLETPFSRLPMWYPSFQLDSALHCPTVPLFSLPDQQLKEMTKTQTATPNSLLDMARMKQPIPVKVGLESENRGNPTSTNNGASSSNAAAASSSAAMSTSAPAPAASASSSTLNHKSLSVLSPAVRAAMASRIESSQALMLSAGDPKERAVLRQLMALRPLYEAIKLRLKMEQNRPNIPIEELLPKLRSSSLATGAGGASANDFSDASVVKPLLALLATHLPHWCSIGSSGRPPMEIFRTRKTGEIDPVSGRDRNVPILEALVERQQAILKQEADRFAPASAVSKTIKTQKEAEPTPMETDEIKVKIEASEESPTAAAAAAPTAASTEVFQPVKIESIAAPSTLAHASAVASAVKNIAASRLASPNKAAIVAASPSKRMTNSSRAASMVAGASSSAAKKPAAANLLARMR